MRSVDHKRTFAGIFAINAAGTEIFNAVAGLRQLIPGKAPEGAMVKVAVAFFPAPSRVQVVTRADVADKFRPGGSMSSSRSKLPTALFWPANSDVASIVGLARRSLPKPAAVFAETLQSVLSLWVI